MADKTAEKISGADHTPHPARPINTGANPVHLSETQVATASSPLMPMSAAVGPAAPVPATPKRIPPPPLAEMLFYLQEQKQNRWYALIPKNVALGDLLEKEYWSYVRAKLQPGNIICCFREDRTWYIELVVFQVGANWVSVSILNGPIYPDAGSVGKSIATDFEIRELGEIKKYGVVRISDLREVTSGHATQEAASRWLAEYLRTMSNQRAA